MHTSPSHPFPTRKTKILKRKMALSMEKKNEGERFSLVSPSQTTTGNVPIRKKTFIKVKYYMEKPLFHLYSTMK